MALIRPSGNDFSFVRSTLQIQALVRVLDMVIVLCSPLKHFTLTAPSSGHTGVYVGY